ncbi:MAG: glycosyltransferase family 4 protein [Bacteroidales bacterium]|nr:glycosyltransferase family 4 protein [Bacteroidales bacterium]
MKIAINTRLLLKNKLEGIGWFTFETLKRITQAHPEHEFIFLFDRPTNPEFIFGDNVKTVVINIPARHPVLWYLFFEWGVTKALKRNKADLFLSTDGWISLRSKVPSVNVIHDLNFVHHPEYIKPVTRIYYRFFFKKFAQRPIRLAAVSEYTRQDIHKTFDVPLEKIDVVYNGSNDFYKPLSNEEKEIVLEKYTNGVPYFVFIGALHYRKNLTGLFKAFDLFKEENNVLHKLVIVGGKKWWKGEIAETYNAMKYRDEVILLGRVEPEELNNVLSSALALMYVSFFEGFGIPIIEAFNAGTAVITSNTTSMPEVAGDAAEIVNPYSIDSIAKAMEKVAFDEDYRKLLIEKGFKRKELFSWDITAYKLWQTIAKVL